MADYVYRDGSRLTPHMAYQIDRLNRDFKKRWGLEIRVSSGIRLNSEQRAIFLRRYTRTPNGRRVYDTRWWEGKLWYRISSAGTVAPPGSSISNHEIQGSKAAVDIRDTGSDSGVTVKNSARGRWIRANAHKYGMVASGDGFGEGWHFDMTGIYNTVPGGSGSSGKGKEVIHYHHQDPNARGAGRSLKPGDHFWLNTRKGAGTSKATNLTHLVGSYSLTAHVYATGIPGDVLELVYAWDDAKRGNAHSYHYVERLVVDKDGKVNASREFKRGVAKGEAVYARLTAPKSNKGTVKVTLFDSDAFRFTA